MAYESLRAKLPANSHLESFSWSGRNSMAARTEASCCLQLHLRQSLSEHPNDCHIVLGHSHGGTVASEALNGSDLDGAIRGLICLATPFTYLALPSLRRLQGGILALTSILYVIYWTALLSWSPMIPELLGFLPFACVVAVKALLAFFLVAVIAKANFEAQDTALRPSGPKSTPIFLLRGSRDEASLLLAEAQFFDSICATFTSLNDVTQLTIRKPLTWVGYALVYTTCCALGVFAAIHVAPVLIPYVGREALVIIGMLVYAPAVAGLIYWLGYAVVAVCAGHRDFVQWLMSVVEVEAAPPNTTCQVHVFSELDTSGLRHSLYEDDRVLTRVADLAQSILNSQ